MTLLDRVHAHRDEILRLAATFGASSVRMFGSAARGEEHDGSDIDLLVDWSDQASLVDCVAFQQEVEKLIGTKVDIISSKSLHWFIRDTVLAEARPLP